LNRKFLGIDKEKEYLEISKARKIEIENYLIAEKYKSKISGFNDKEQLNLFLVKEPVAQYKVNNIKGITNCSK